MKVVIVSKSDGQGGAFRAAYRLHTGFRALGVDSKMLVDSKRTDDPHVYGSIGNISKAWSKVRPFVDRVPLKFYDRQNTPFHPAWIGRNIVQHELLKQTDIINLHWITEGFLSTRGISKLVELGKPVVWTLHDMWPFTGGCHYSGDCEKYTNSCGACPQLKSDKDNDITRKIWRKKRGAYKGLNLTIVTPSRWLAECAKSSSLLSDLKVEVIPYGLNTDIFKPVEKLTARNILNLPKNKKIILFGAISGTANKLKGFKYLKEAISRLEKMKAFHKGELCLVIFGASHSRNVEGIPSQVKFLGRLYDDFSLTLSYSAADIFMIPSLQDNLPNTVMESLSCGTPVVGFNIGGMSEMIEHQVNGYLSEYRNSKSLAEGIQWILGDENRAFKLGETAQKKAVEKYSLKIQAEIYVNLYEKLLDEVSGR